MMMMMNIIMRKPVVAQMRGQKYLYRYMGECKYQSGVFQHDKMNGLGDMIGATVGNQDSRF